MSRNKKSVAETKSSQRVCAKGSKNDSPRNISACAVGSYSADAACKRAARPITEKYCCFAAWLYTLQLREMLSAWTNKDVVDAVTEYLEHSDTDPHDITYYPEIEGTFEGEDVFAELIRECEHRDLPIPHAKRVTRALEKCRGNIVDGAVIDRPRG